MLLDFNKDTILKLTDNFLKDNPNISNYEDVRELPGKEHYYLLASLSMQLKNKKILELGTHTGRSAIALNYGNLKQLNNNTIYTYDISNILIPNIFDYTNINFKIENLFNSDIREINKDHILSADLIFIDIDPHSGILEYSMYIWLKNNNYKGLILFDDIHLDEGHMGVYTGSSMKQFWAKIDDKNKIDLTSVGHWSGTGLVSFNFSNYTILY